MDRPTAAVFNPQKFRLGEVMVSNGLITEAQLKDALAQQKLSGRKLGRVLTDLKFVSEAEIGEVVAGQLNISFVDLNRRELDAALVRSLPEAQARRFRALVLGRKNGGLEVGVVDPADSSAVSVTTTGNTGVCSARHNWS